MKKIVITSPLGHVKHKSKPPQPKAMVLEAFKNVRDELGKTDKASRYYSTGNLFNIAISVKTDQTIRAGLVIVIRDNTGNSTLGDEHSITIPLLEASELIRDLQDIVNDIHKDAELIISQRSKSSS
jgi:hypothetical protein